MLLSVVIGAAVGVALSPACRIWEVRVVGPTQSVADEVASKIQLPLRANTVFLPLQAVSAAEHACYRVKSLAVRRNPWHGITVTVHEREPVVALASDDGYTLVDKDGICLIRTDTPGVLPVFRGLASERPTLGDRIPPEWLSTVRACLAGAAAVQAAEGAQFDFSNTQLSTLKTRDGVVGKLGDMRNLQRKIVLFGQLLHGLRADGESVAYIDVRVENKPTWRRSHSH